MTTRVFSAHAGRATLTQRYWEAILSGPPDSVLAHISSCAHLGLCSPRGSDVHVIHLGPSWKAPRGVRPHATSVLPDTDRILHRGVPCTSVARSLFDAARDAETVLLDDMLDTAVRLEMYDGDDMERVIGDRPTVRGVDRIIEAVGRLDGKSGTFLSNFERRTTRLVEQSGLIPAPVINVLVAGFRPDLWWFGTRAIVECDGRDYHRSPAQIDSDARREEILRAKGFVFLRLRWSQVVYEPERTLARIERFVLANLDAPVQA